MSRKRRLLLISSGLAFLFSAAALADSGQCGAKEKNSRIYKAFSSCASRKVVNDANDLALELDPLHQEGFCLDSELSPTLSGTHAQFCADPFSAVCAPQHQNIMTSDCKLMEESAADVADLPDVVDDHCAFLAKEDAFLKAHETECPAEVSQNDCRALLMVKHVSEIQNLETKIAYTKERVKHFTELFNKVINTMVARIRSSKLIPETRKHALLKLIGATHLALPTGTNDPECMHTAATGPEAGFYNQDGMVVVCIGAMESMNHVGDADILMTLGHEISHSIDPCALEMAARGAGNPDPEIALKTYPGLLQCLRGGAGKDGCSNSVLHCTSEQGIMEFCQDPSNNVTDLSTCLLEAHQMPSCEIWGASDATQQSMDVSLFRKNGTPVDQIEESFADYFGAEVVSSLLQNANAENKVSTEQSELDAMAVNFVDIAQLHGGCRTENTKDAHPPSFLRINRILMSSPSLRHALGCTQGPPHTQGAGVSCQKL